MRSQCPFRALQSCSECWTLCHYNTFFFSFILRNICCNINLWIAQVYRSPLLPCLILVLYKSNAAGLLPVNTWMNAKILKFLPFIHSVLELLQEILGIKMLSPPKKVSVIFLLSTSTAKKEDKQRRHLSKVKGRAWMLRHLKSANSSFEPTYALPKQTERRGCGVPWLVSGELRHSYLPCTCTTGPRVQWGLFLTRACLHKSWIT